MKLKEKILYAIICILALSFVGFVFYKQNENKREREAINKQMVEFKQLQDEIARSQSQFSTKQDLEKIAKENHLNLNAIQKNISELNSSLTGINKVVVSSKGVVATNVPSTEVIPRPVIITNNNDTFGYLSNEQVLKITETFAETSVPFADVSFQAWQEKPWGLSIFPRTYSVVNVLATDENNRHFVYNKFILTVDGKDYSLKINDAKFIEEYPKPNFYLLNPKLFVGFNGTVFLSPVVGDAIPEIGFGSLSYGNSKVNPDLFFLQLGLGYGIVQRNANVSVSPILYNLGKQIPFISNTYIGPNIQVGFDGNVGVGFGLKVGL